jgi:hypothetical protein
MARYWAGNLGHLVDNPTGLSSEITTRFSEVNSVQLTGFERMID